MATPDPPLLPAPEEPKLLPAPRGPQPAPAASGHRHAKPVTAIALAAFVLLAFAIGWFLHHRRNTAAEESNERERNAMPLVSVVAVKRSPELGSLLLPGSLSPITQASLYARASGYVRRRYVDLGDTVTKGQVLAEIESPELDQQVAQGTAATAQARQQLNQARAAVGDAQARLDLARVTWLRYDALLQSRAVARQEVDQHRQEFESAQAMVVSAGANVGAAAENVRAAEANQRRLTALQDYKRLRAPFDGIITARNVDEGALIGGTGGSLVGGGASPLNPMASGQGSGGSSSTGTSDSGSSGSTGAGGSGAEMFRIAQVDRLRVYIGVPQESAGAVQVGAVATVLLQEFDAPFTGRVTRTARAIDPASRTLLAEVQIDNPGHTLMPGMYAQVRFTSARANPPLLVPGEALLARADGMRVAVLRPLDDEARKGLPEDAQADARCARQVRLQTVSVGRDYGTDIEVTRGLADGDFLVLNPGDDVTGDAVVLPHLQPANDKDAGGGGKKAGGAGGGASPASGSGDSKGGDSKGGDSKAGKSKADDGQDGQSGDGRQSPDEQEQRRAEARRTCIEDQAGSAAASASAPATAPAGQAANTAASGATGGPGDQSPAGIGSPSMAAPTQGQRQRGGKS